MIQKLNGGGVVDTERFGDRIDHRGQFVRSIIHGVWSGCWLVVGCFGCYLIVLFCPALVVLACSRCISFDLLSCSGDVAKSVDAMILLVIQLTNCSLLGENSRIESLQS